MPLHVVPTNTKSYIPALLQDGYSVKEICVLLGIKKTLVYKTLSFYNNFGVVYNPHTYSRTIGRRRILNQADRSFIQDVLRRQNTIYLDELQHELWVRRRVYATVSTLSRELQRLDLTRKKISFAAAERNEELRALYMNRIGAEAPDPEMLVFIDEAAKDQRTSSRPHGWSLKGRRCHGQRYFIRGMRYSILPAITLDGIIAYDIIEGPVDGERFLRFLEEHVMPFTNPYPGPRSVLIMDNCRIHQGEQVRALVEDMHLCKLIYLPPYSPDYNPIEEAFSSIKSYLRRHNDDLSMMAIIRACQNITPDKALSYFRASGYIA